MASTIATGGAGTHYESRVAAYFLGTVLCHATARGLPQGVLAQRVKFQRAFEGDKSSLDDVILEGVSSAEECCLSLQVKRTLTFGDNDLFKEVMNDCWKTFSAPEFKKGLDRFGVAIGNNPQIIEQAGRNVLDLAKNKAEATEFLNHLSQEKVASNDMRSFAQNIRSRIDEAKGSSVTDVEFWEFLRHFEILHFDYEQGDSSQSLHHSVSSLVSALITADSNDASKLWEALIGIADEYKPAAGSLIRDTLIENLHNRFRLSGLQKNTPDLDKIKTSSRRVLDSISHQLGTVYLDRSESLSNLISRSSECDFIEITGEPGSGKSALLKAFAEIKAQNSPIIVVDAKRLPETPGLESLERLWGISGSLNQLIPDLSQIERPCLFIDAIDRIEDAGRWATINDLIRCIRQSASGKRWCIVVTARANTLDYRQNITDSAMGKKQGRVNVDLLSPEEIEEVATIYSELSNLIKDNGMATDLAKRPYLLSRLIKSKKISAENPANKLTEIDLMLDLWTDDGGRGAAFRIQRQTVLTNLGKALLEGNSLPKAFDVLQTDALHSLEQDDILRTHPISGKIEFCHDILEDWVLCRCLDDESVNIFTLLQTLNQPLWLVEGIQLLAQYYLEKKEGTTAWQELLQSVSDNSLDPRWRRIVVTASLQSPCAVQLLVRIEKILFSDEAKLLRELMVALRTVEIFPNTSWYNPQVQIDGLDDSMRRELAYLNASPRPKAWRPFLGWLFRRIGEIPPHLVSELSKVLEVMPRSMGSMPDWLSGVVVDWARDWLRVVDFHWGWNRDEDDKLAERLRYLILSSAEGANEKVAAYLKDVQEDDRHRGAEYIIQNSNLLVPHLPKELADFMMAVMRPSIDDDEIDDDVGFGSRRDSILIHQELGIDEDRLFFPAAHIRPPFLMLLRYNEAEGLRLINGLCNHAIHVWRSLRSGGREGSAIPVRMSFLWGSKEFWGHEREYLWFRALGVGPYSVCSALMALEAWMEEEIKKGRNQAELFGTVLKDNDCVAALGICVSLILANPEAALDVAIPFVTNPYLWDWDLRRTVLERPGPSNLIGFMPKDRLFGQQVLERNQLPHRQEMLRNIVPMYFLVAKAETQAAFLAKMKETVEGELPFQYEEWKGNPNAESYLKDQIRRMEAMSDPQNYQLYNTEDGKKFILQYEHPSDLAPEAEAIAKEQAELGGYIRIALWVEKSLENGILQQDITIQEAVSKAREWDDPDLFSVPLSFEDMKRHKRAAAVSGTAAILLKFGNDLSNTDVEWCRSILKRAVGTPFSEDSLSMRMSIISFHPVLYAVHGLVALVSHGKANQEDKRLILSLVCHPLEMAFQVVYCEIAKCWDVTPELCWQALVLGLKISLMPRSIIPRGTGLTIQEPERLFLDSALNDVLNDERKGCLSSLPSIPLEWTEDLTAKPHHAYGQYIRSEILFMWNYPPKSLFIQPLDKILSDEWRRIEILKLLQEFMAWTAQDCNPPWNDNNRSGSDAYEWLQSFMTWCAELSLYLTAEETNTLIIDPILAIEGRQKDSLLSDFIREFANKHFSQEKVPDQKTITLWKRLCGIIVDHKDAWRIQNADLLTRDYGESVGFVLFCYPIRCLFQHPWPPIDSFSAEIQKWVETFGKSKACYGILLSFLQAAGWRYAPNQAIEWLSDIAESHKDNASFWNANSNGSETADFLEKILDAFESQIGSDPDLIRKIIRIADILTAGGIRTAAQIQQRMAVLSSKHGSIKI